MNRSRESICKWTCKAIYHFLFLFLDFIYLFRERRREGERQGEKHRCVRGTLISCLSQAPNCRPGPQPRHVPWLGIEPATLWFPGRHTIRWTTPARATIYHFKCSKIWRELLEIFHLEEINLNCKRYLQIFRKQILNDWRKERAVDGTGR